MSAGFTDEGGMGLYDGFIDEMEKDAVSLRGPLRRMLESVTGPIPYWQGAKAEYARAKRNYDALRRTGRLITKEKREWGKSARGKGAEWRKADAARKFVAEERKNWISELRWSRDRTSVFRPAAMKRILALSVGGATVLGAGGTGAALLLSRKKSKDKK